MKNDNLSKSTSAPSDVRSWVFLSHSNLDYDKVTLVRNLLEKYHMRPIMFFLRCIEEDKELDGLLKREIDARDQFILCDSKNARDSNWVQKEVDYIKSKERVYQTINLDDPVELIEQAIRGFRNRSKVLMTYSRKDFSLGRMVTERLRKHGFSVFFDADSILGTDFAKTINDAFESAAKEGYQLILLGRNLMNSPWCRSEIQAFIAKGGARWIVPVMIDSSPLTPEYLSTFGRLEIGDVSMYDSDEEKAQNIVEFFVRHDMAVSK